MVTFDGLIKFGSQVTNLPSFPVFVVYLVMVVSSPLWQQISKPLALKKVLVIYNFMCSAISLVTLLGFLRGLYYADFIYQKSTVPELTPIFFIYWVTKNLELMDTVFMILRHRRRQISFLHIYHHASMVLLSDYSYHYTAWPAISVILMLNSFVHVILYFYYGLTAINPNQTPSWKQRLTELQIVQFFIDMIYAAWGFVHHGFCVYGFIYGFAMIGLFSNFYLRAYIFKSKTPKVRKEKVEYNGVVTNGKHD